MPRGSKPGERRGGRAPGKPNKLTKDVKDTILAVAEGLGGAPAMLEWAQRDPGNEKLFWAQIYPKLLPKDLNATVTGDITVSWPLPRGVLDD